MFNREGNEILTSNITMDENSGIGKWSEDEFVNAVKSGILPGN